MRDVGKGSNLKGFEQVKAIKLIPKLMTVDDDLLTPTRRFLFFEQCVIF